MIFYISFIVFLYTSNILSINIGEDIYCREKNRLITSEDSDEYLLASVEINGMVKLLCRYCNDNEEVQPKIWYYQDRLQTLPKREVEIGMDNNVSYNRIYVILDLSLVIKNIEKTDAGIYRCHGQEGQEEEYKFNYRIEPILKDQSDTFIETGNITKWEEYRVINLLSVTMRFAVSKMLDLVYLRQQGIILEVISEWGPWGQCEKCIRNVGIQTRRGYCRLKRQFDKTVILDHTTQVVRFFNKTPMLPCKSILLQDEFPIISNAVKYLPEFVLEETCKNCTKVKKKKKGKKFKYRKQYVFSEGAHFAMSCPEFKLQYYRFTIDRFLPPYYYQLFEYCAQFHISYSEIRCYLKTIIRSDKSTFDKRRSDQQSQIIWKKDSIVLKQGVSRSFRKMDAEARMMVDTFSTLYIIDITKEEEGNYTCYVDNVNMMQMKIIVVSKSKFWTLALLRHMGYLGFILLLTSFCYCTGLIIACRRKDTFKVYPEKNDAHKKGEHYWKEKKKEENMPIICDVDCKE